MPRRAARKRYRVLNPRKIRADVPVITLLEKSDAGLVIQEINLHEGERFVPPENVDLEPLLQGGFIERV